MTRQRVSCILFGTLLAVSAAILQATGRVEFTRVPAQGQGSDSRGDISGRVSGLDAPQNYKVVLYCHTDRWYVQPEAASPLTDIAKDGTWSNWTHLGGRYAALVVQPTFQPTATLQALPAVAG